MTSPVQTLRVALSERSYDIEIGSGNLPHVAEFVQQRGSPRQVVVVTDKNVEHPHAAAAEQAFEEKQIKVQLVVVDAGESQKSMANVQQLLEKLLTLGADRHTFLVAVGGGVIGDLAGFLAAIYARGIPFVQVPTTLLAHVDSSVGGKVGVNLSQAKNMVGAFWQPRGVLIDTSVLETLPDREYRSGLAEVVKYGVILDADFFRYLEQHVAEINAREPAALQHIIYRSCELKAEVVSQDEREETGLRAVLNYGHTFAHPFESLTGYQNLLHGEAVSMGMVCASRLAARLGRIPDSMTQQQHNLLTALHLPVEPPQLDIDRVLEVMTHDKKAQHGRLRFVLPTRLGHVELVSDINPDDVRAVLAP